MITWQVVVVIARCVEGQFTAGSDVRSDRRSGTLMAVPMRKGPPERSVSGACMSST